MSTTEKLAKLNELRAARNQAPLKSWKGSSKALDETLTAYQTKKVEPAVAEGAYANGREAEHRTGLKGKDEAKREAIRKANEPKAEKPAKAVKAEKKVATKAKPASDLVSLADIARDLKIEPKLARAKARRNEELTKLAQGDAWAFKPADVAAVKKILKG